MKEEKTYVYTMLDARGNPKSIWYGDKPLPEYVFDDEYPLRKKELVKVLEENGYTLVRYA